MQHRLSQVLCRLFPHLVDHAEGRARGVVLVHNGQALQAVSVKNMYHVLLGGNLQQAAAAGVTKSSGRQCCVLLQQVMIGGRGQPGLSKILHQADRHPHSVPER